MYDPVTARFMQEDTYRGQANDPLSLNLYTYCHNEPVMYTDPTGHIAFSSWQDAAAYSKAITKLKTTTKVTTSSQAKAYTQAAQKATVKYSAPTPTTTKSSTAKTTTTKTTTAKAVTGKTSATTIAKASNNVQGKAKVTTLEEAIEVSKNAEAEKKGGILQNITGIFTTKVYDGGTKSYADVCKESAKAWGEVLDFSSSGWQGNSLDTKIIFAEMAIDSLDGVPGNQQGVLKNSKSTILKFVDEGASEIAGDVSKLGKYDVGIYNKIKGVSGLDAHHVGQKALMKDFIPGYNPETAPSILVPKVGIHLEDQME